MRPTIHSVFARELIALALVCGCLPSVFTAQAQTASSQPLDTSKSVPRLADGKPDFNGTWDNGSGIEFVNPQKQADGSICVIGCAPRVPPTSAASPPLPSSPKYKPQFQAKVKDLEARQVETDPVLRCKAPGVPRIGPPDKIVQTPGQVVFLYDDVSGGFFRIIPTDGRAHRSDVDESYLGDAVGHWEGDTLVVVSQNFNDETWLTDNGAFHSKQLKVTEHLRRSGDEMQWDAVAEDPVVLAEPWHVRPRKMTLTKVELVEPAPCVDQDLAHIVDGSHHTNPR